MSGFGYKRTKEGDSSVVERPLFSPPIELQAPVYLTEN